MLPLVQANPPLPPLSTPAYQRLLQAVRPFRHWADRLPNHYDLIVRPDEEGLAVALTPNSFPETLILKRIPRVAGELWPHLAQSPLFPQPEIVEYFMGEEEFWVENVLELYEEQNEETPSTQELYAWAREQGFVSPNMVLETFNWERPNPDRPLEELLDTPGYPGRIARTLWLLKKTAGALDATWPDPFEEASYAPPYLVLVPRHPPVLEPAVGVEALLDAIEHQAQYIEVVYDAYLIPAQPEPIYRLLRFWWLSDRLFWLLKEWEVDLAQEDPDQARPHA